MENLVARQMNNYLVSKNFLSARQSGLVDVVNDLRLKLDENYIAFVVILDYTKVFDTVDHEILLSKEVCGLICSYLMNRSQRV